MRRFYISVVVLAVAGMLGGAYVPSLGERSYSYQAQASEAETFELATSTGASYNWAGYVAEEGLYTAVSGTWVVSEVLPSEELSGNATWVEEMPLLARTRTFIPLAHYDEVGFVS